MQRRQHMVGPGAGPGVLDRLALRVVLAAAGAPRLALAALVVLVLASGVAATRLGIDTDSSRMLSPDLPFQARAHEVNAAFPETKNTILVVVRSANGDAADAATADIAARLAARGGVIRSVFAPSADEFLVAHGLLYADLETVEERLSRISQSANLIAELRADRSVEGFLGAVGRATALAEGAEIDVAALSPLMGEAARVFASVREGDARPFDWSAVGAGPLAAGPTRTMRVITVLPDFDFTRLSPAKPAIEAVREEVAALDPDLARLVDVGVTGDPVLRAEELESVTARLGLSFLLSLLLVAVVLFLTLRRATRVVLALSTVFATLALTTGFAALTIGALNLISVAFVVLMVGLGIDFAIHLLAHLDEDVDRGLDVPGALRATTGSIGGALVLSAATTSFAFLAFATTDFVGMAQLGLIGGAGVLIALGVALVAIPAAVSLRPGLARGRGPLFVPSLGRWGGRIGTALALAAGIAALVLVPDARFDADPMGLRDPTAPSVVAYDWITGDPAVAPLRLSVLVDSPEQAREAAARAEAVEGVRNAVWLGDLVPREQEAKLDLIDLAYPSLLFAVEGDAVDLGADDDAPLEERLAGIGTPEAAALAREVALWREARTAQRDTLLAGELFRFFPMMIDRLALQLEAGEVAIEDLPEPLVDRFRSGDGRLRVEISAEGDMSDPAERRRFTEAVTAALPEAGGPPAQIVGAAETVSSSMTRAAATALAGTAVMAWLALRSFFGVAAILLPLALSGAVTMAASVLLDMPFNYANVIVLPLMIGIGVDAGVHLAIRTLRAEAAVFDTSTPRAVLASALTTVAAFGTLALSDHVGTASMGLMLAIALGVSVLMIFALTPPLIRLSRR